MKWLIFCSNKTHWVCIFIFKTTWKSYLKNNEKNTWKFTKKSWKYHGILSVRKSGNPEIWSKNNYINVHHPLPYSTWHFGVNLGFFFSEQPLNTLLQIVPFGETNNIGREIIRKMNCFHAYKHPLHNLEEPCNYQFILFEFQTMLHKKLNN